MLYVYLLSTFFTKFIGVISQTNPIKFLFVLKLCRKLFLVVLKFCFVHNHSAPNIDNNLFEILSVI